jgi:hypothetical protein
VDDTKTIIRPKTGEAYQAGGGPGGGRVGEGCACWGQGKGQGKVRQGMGSTRGRGSGGEAAGWPGPGRAVATPSPQKHAQAWPVVHTVLSDAKLKSISCEEALKLQGQGWTLVDVRLEGDFVRGHAEGAVNVPLYRFVEGRVGALGGRWVGRAGVSVGGKPQLEAGGSLWSGVEALSARQAAGAASGSGPRPTPPPPPRARRAVRPRQGPWDQAKRLAMAAFAMRATERNPDFVGERMNFPRGCVAWLRG